MPSEAPVLSPSDGDLLQSARPENEAAKKHVTFASDTRAESPSADAYKSTKPKRDPARSRRHLVYAIKLTEDGLWGWSESHPQPLPTGLSDEALREQWLACKGMMASPIPWRCSDDFDLPVVNGGVPYEGLGR